LKEKIIPAFEKAHGPEYQALFMVDNSQGHSAYPADALLVQRMNLGPGGKKPCMRNGWFMRGGEKVSHSMVMPSTDSGSPQPKGMQMILEERGLWPRGGLRLKCPKNSCIPEATTCCATRLMSLQPDFLEQRSLVQETIENAGHICIFLPKFHCELNFIEFFWGAVKRYCSTKRPCISMVMSVLMLFITDKTCSYLQWRSIGSALWNMTLRKSQKKS
jgi:hypothetical protein